VREANSSSVNDASFAFNKANNATLRDLDIGYYFVQLTNLYNAGVRKFLLLNIPRTSSPTRHFSNGMAKLTLN
jgi:hypothetical protein